MFTPDQYKSNSDNLERLKAKGLASIVRDFNELVELLPFIIHISKVEHKILARETGIASSSFSRKVNLKAEWRPNEIIKLLRALGY